MEFVNKHTIKLDKEINELDKLVFKFVKILEKHTPYVIVSGYVAILLGRDRGTEDVYIIIPKLDMPKLAAIYASMVKDGYWCLNSSDIEDIYHLLTSKSSIRFAPEPKVSPNFEIKLSKDAYDDMALKNPTIMKIGKEGIKTSFLELQIAFKEEVLKSNKDIEDANHIRLVAKGHLDENLINEYKKKLGKR
jgi:hypothetical protein